MAQLSTTVNTWQSGTLPSNTIQNLKNDAHCMAITTRGGKQTIDPPMPSNEEKVRKYDNKVVKGSGEVEDSTGKDAEVPMKVIPMTRLPPPFPQRLVKKTEDGKYRHFITMLNQLFIKVPLVEALEQMSGYAKFMKDLVTKTKSITLEDHDRMQHCSAIATRSLAQKKENPGAFTIPCTVGSLHFAKTLCYLGANINLMPLSIYKKLGSGDPKPTTMRLLIADRTVKRPIRILHDVLVKVLSFIFPTDFVILHCEVDFKVPIILGRQFLATSKALVDKENGQMKFWLNNEEATFNICRSMRQSGNPSKRGMQRFFREKYKKVPPTELVTAMTTIRETARKFEDEIVNAGVPPQNNQAPTQEQAPKGDQARSILWP
ncbi:uncharacterized protein [Solanum lycopersicum]|uniref:uncharacterized protein n=1 Tax=Solanum lycopersicum TaxID=4081 RepID=UPI003749F777